MINITDKVECCGCSACATVCAKKCITMQEDREGFLYPEVDATNCNECGLCEKVCPIIQVKPDTVHPQKAFLVQIKDEKILRESTSGGAFTAIATWVLKQGGVVFGAAFVDGFEVKHTAVENIEDLKIYRNSKYVQSKVNGTYSEVKSALKAGKWVCYSGTPCQLEGLFCYLRKRYEKLITVDVVCRACPSPLVLRKYLSVQQARLNSSFNSVKFRDKHYGYKYSTMSLVSQTPKKAYHEGIDTDQYLRSFFSGANVRPSCFKCVFKKQYRAVDFTIWDCFDVDKFSKELDNDKGVTRILTNTDRALEILKAIKNDIKCIEIDTKAAVAGVKEIYHSASRSPKRDEFFNDLHQMNAEACFNKHFPITLRHRLEKKIRLTTNKLGIYKIAKKTFKTINGSKEIKR